MVKNLPSVQETWTQSLGWEDPWEKGMATQSSILAWRIPMDRGALWATVHGVAKSRTQLSNYQTHTHTCTHTPTLLVAVKISTVQFSSVTQWCSTICEPVDCSMPGLPVHCQLLGVTQTHVRWVGDAIQPSHPIIPFPSCLQSFPASGSFLVSQFFESGGQSLGVLASASVLPMNIQDWFPLRWTGWISLQSKGLSRVFSNTTVQKHQFFSAQLSLQSNSHIHTWLLEKP